jgi:hypothetical protein
VAGGPPLGRWSRLRPYPRAPLCRSPCHDDAVETATPEAKRFYRRAAEGAAERSASIEGGLRRRASWQDRYEWRIGTETTVTVARVEQRFRVEVSCDASFAATVDRLQDAAEAAAVLEHVTIYLFYAVGWPSWAGWQRMRPSDAEPQRSLPRTRSLCERYLQRLARESRNEWSSLRPAACAALAEQGVWEHDVRSITRSARGGSAELLEDVGPLGGPPDPEWLAEPEDIFEVSVHSGRLLLTCATPTLDRAGEFAGIFARVGADMARVFAWARP